MIKLRRNRSFSPSVENMEERKLLSTTLTVTNFTDSSAVQGSLRWAVETSNVIGSTPTDPNTIRFQSNISYGVIQVTHGPIPITSSVNITGDSQQISGGGVSQIFATYGANTVANFTNLTLEHGRADGLSGHYNAGGAIISFGAGIGLYGDVFIDDTAAYAGGAVYGHSGQVWVSGSRFTQNSAGYYGGAIACAPQTPLVFTGPTSMLYYNTAGLGGGAVQVQTGYYFVRSPQVYYDHNFVGHDYTNPNNIYFY